MVAWTCVINHRRIYVSRVSRLHSFIPCFDNSLHSHGIVTKHLFPDFTCWCFLLVFEMAKQVELSIRCVVKGYHECPFKVNIGETFYAFKKRGERGNAFKVTNGRGQLGHLQIELDSPLWPSHEKITV